MIVRNRTSILFYLLLLCLILLAGCGSDSNSGGSSESGSEAQKKSDSGGEPVHITFMGWEASPLETESVKRGLELFMEQNPDIVVEYTPVPGDHYSTRLLTMLAGNAAPDVFFLGSTDYRAFQQRGVLLNLTSYFDAEYSLSDFIPSAAEIMNIDGEIYGVSSSTVSPVLYYNKDLFDAANLPYPPSNPDEAWTWDEFLDVARQLTIVENGETVQYGVFGFEDHYMTVALLMTNHANVFNDDFTASAINTPEAQEVFQAILDMRVKEGVSPEAIFLEKAGMSASQILQTGKVGMLVTGSWALQELAKMGFPVGVGVLPKFQVPATHGQAHVHAAAASTEHPEAAWRLISFLSSEEYQIDLISEGLWMPNRISLYSDEGIDRWYNEEVHPEGFRELVPYIREAKAYPYTQMLTTEILNNTIDELEKFWYDDQPIDVTTANIEEMVNRLLAESP